MGRARFHAVRRRCLLSMLIRSVVLAGRSYSNDGVSPLPQRGVSSWSRRAGNRRLSVSKRLIAEQGRNGPRKLTLRETGGLFAAPDLDAPQQPLLLSPDEF